MTDLTEVAPHGLVVVSNRGPVAFKEAADGTLVGRRGAGGLVSTLGPAVADSGALWVAAAMSAADRAAAGSGQVEAAGFHLRLLTPPVEAYQPAIDVICNQTLWMLHHALFDLVRRPSLDAAWHDAWDAYVAVNDAFAEAVAEDAPEQATVAVQDLHLCLVGARLRELRPDLRTTHFAHTPFSWPDQLAVLPDAARLQLLDGLAAHGACGFHTTRWEAAFRAGIDEAGIAATTFVAPAAADPDDVRSVAQGDACARHLDDLDSLVGDRAFIVRVDRMEPSKNIVRGFAAYDHLLATRPELRERVVFGAFCYPSRDTLPEYVAYRAAVFEAVDDVNSRWGTRDWEPIHLVTEDDFPRSVAALRRADVALINPVRDGLNIVAKELAIVNERGAVLCLSPQAGVWDELGHAGALATPPFDLVATADALHQALTMPASERAERAARLLAAATARTPADWLGDQLRAAR